MNKTTFVLIFVVTMLLAGIAATAVAQESLEQKVDALFEPLLLDDMISGSVLIARGDNILLAKGYGPANREYNIPNSAETKFRLGSISKQFTAMGILILADRGLLDTGDPLSRFLPDFPNAENITLHQLLTHTSGVVSYNRNPTYGEKLVQEMSINEVIDWFKDDKPSFAPGEKFEYSNSGYVLLAAVIEKVSGETFEDFLKKNIFIPLGMADTGVDHHENILANRANGHGRYLEIYQAPYRNLPFTNGAGSLFSTVFDLYKWDRSLYTGKLVSAGMLHKMFTPEKETYGYGFFIREHAGHKLIEHSGAINGFYTQIYRLVDDDIVVVSLFNYESTFSRRVNEALLNIALGLDYEPVYHPGGLPLNEEEASRVIGTYDLGNDSTFSVSLDEGKLIFEDEGVRLTALPQAPLTYFVKERNLMVQFQPGEDDAIDKVYLVNGLHPFRARRAKTP